MWSDLFSPPLLPNSELQLEGRQPLPPSPGSGAGGGRSEYLGNARRDGASNCDKCDLLFRLDSQMAARA